jgi:hypothetical protein
VSFAQKMVLIWLYKRIDNQFLLGGKPYGTIRQYPMAIRKKCNASYEKNSNIRPNYHQQLSVEPLILIQIAAS